LRVQELAVHSEHVRPQPSPRTGDIKWWVDQAEALASGSALP